MSNIRKVDLGNAAIAAKKNRVRLITNPRAKKEKSLDDFLYRTREHGRKVHRWGTA